MNKLQDNFGENLDRVMKEKHVSQSKLSLWTDISTSGIYRYVQGERHPNLCVIIRMADALECDVTDLTDDIAGRAIGDITTLNKKQRKTLDQILKKYDREIPPVKLLRAQTGLSQAEFAEKYNEKLHSVRNWESGEWNPPDYTLKMLTRFVNKDYPVQDHSESKS